MPSQLPRWASVLFVLGALTLGRSLVAQPVAAGPAPSAEKAPPKAAAPKPATTAAAAGTAQSAPQPAAKSPESKPKPAPAAPPRATPGPAKAAPAPAGTASGPLGKTVEETHILKLRDLESRIDELKEQIRRSHARLSLLSETLLSGGLGGARADLVFKNQMSNAFRIRRILVVLDGAVQYKKQDETDELSNQKEIPVFTGPIPPGDHTLQVVVGMQGHGYGVFSYLKAFKPEVKHTRSFTVEEGKAIRIEITAWEKGSATTPLEQRPALRLTEKIVDRREAELDGVE